MYSRKNIPSHFQGKPQPEPSMPQNMPIESKEKSSPSKPIKHSVFSPLAVFLLLHTLSPEKKDG